MTPTLRGIGQLAAYLPYSLGFHPHESVVAVGQIAREIGLTARQDILLDEPADRPAQGIAALFARERHDVVQLFGTCDGPDPLPQLLALRRALTARAVRVDHTILLDGAGGWKAAQCVCGDCPREWTALPDLSGHHVVAEAVLQGVAPLSRREDLEVALEPDDPWVVDEVARLAEAAPAPSPAGIGTAIRALLPEGGPPAGGPPRAACVAVASAGLQSVMVRDTVLAWLLPSLVRDEPTLMPALSDALGPPPQSPASLAAALTHWCRSTPERLRPPVLTLLAATQWQAGGGALGQIACERALQIDPCYKLAQLVQQALGSAVRPTWREQAGFT